jgi:hypothetical protein
MARRSASSAIFAGSGRLPTNRPTEWAEPSGRLSSPSRTVTVPLKPA